MKKLIFLIIIVAGLIYLFRGGDTPTTQNTLPTNSDFKPDPSNATFTFEDGEVISNPDILDQKAYGDLNGDNKTDTALLLADSGGATGVFIYIAAYVSGPVSYKGTNAVFLGDRVSPQSVSISNGVVTAKYLDRKADEPFSAEPTVLVTKQFVYRNGSFVER